jgi:hypothetical protein
MTYESGYNVYNMMNMKIKRETGVSGGDVTYY